MPLAPDDHPFVTARLNPAVITPVLGWVAGAGAVDDVADVDESAGRGGGGAVAAGVETGLLVGVDDVGAGVLTAEVEGTVGGAVGSGTTGGTAAPSAVAGIGGGGAVAAGVEVGAGAGFPDGGTVVTASVGEGGGEVGGVPGAGVVVPVAAAVTGGGEPGVWTLAAQLGGATIVTLTFTGAPAVLEVDVGAGALDDVVGWATGLEVVDTGDGDAICVSAGVGDWPAPVRAEGVV